MNENNIEQDSLKAWLLAARPKTLTGAAVPVLIGLALAWVDTRSFTTDVFSWTAALLCMAFALLMQIDANFINDFFDYARGNDDAEMLDDKVPGEVADHGGNDAEKHQVPEYRCAEEHIEGWELRSPYIIRFAIYNKVSW